MQRGEKPVSLNEIDTYAGVVVGGIILVLLGYKQKPKEPDSVVASVGLELGNRAQMDMLITEVKRCADSLGILADRKQAAIEDRLDEVLERLEERERRN
jgi:hypothetical protein